MSLNWLGWHGNRNIQNKAIITWQITDRCNFFVKNAKNANQNIIFRRLNSTKKFIYSHLLMLLNDIFFFFVLFDTTNHWPYFYNLHKLNASIFIRIRRVFIKSDKADKAHYYLNHTVDISFRGNLRLFTLLP